MHISIFLRTSQCTYVSSSLLETDFLNKDYQVYTPSFYMRTYGTTMIHIHQFLNGSF
jgi:hypothetical protein